MTPGNENQQPTRSSIFPETLWTLVIQASGEEGGRALEALGALATHYRTAICNWFGRLGLPGDRAEDLTHDFIVELLQGRVLAGFRREYPRFRSYLAVCLGNYLCDQLRSEKALKRGGGVPPLELDEEVSDPRGNAHTSLLDKAFALEVHRHALDAVKKYWVERGMQGRFEVLQPFILGAPQPGQYEAAAQCLGLKLGLIRKNVFDLREAYCNALRSEIARTTQPEDLEPELRYIVTLLGGVE